MIVMRLLLQYPMETSPLPFRVLHHRLCLPQAHQSDLGPLLTMGADERMLKCHRM